MKENFLSFMSSTAGRGTRIVMGLVLAVIGLFVIEGAGGAILAVVALIPIVAGIFDLCLAGLILGYGLQGSEIRSKLFGS